MKQFVFTLQQWYDLQTGTEKQYKLQINLLENRIAVLRNELSILAGCFDRTKVEFCDAVSIGMPALRAGDYGNYFECTKIQMAAVQIQIANLENEKEQWVKKLVQVRREIKLLDKLYEKQYKEYIDEVKKENGKIIDDMVSYKVTVS
ncbi:MAG: flagellar export protein FliJ [Christensenellales bacterium]